MAGERDLAGGRRDAAAVLRDVAGAFRARLRSHDLLIRIGRDEFVVTGLGLAEASSRFSAVARAVAAAPGYGSASVGVVQLRDGESASQVIARADAALYEQRRSDRA